MSEERKITCGAGSAPWALILSIALNLFLIGVLVAPMIGPHPDFGPNGGSDRPPFMQRFDGRMGGAFGPDGRGARRDGPRADVGKDRGPTFIFEQVARDLPEAEAKKLREILDTERSEIGKSHDGMRETMSKVADIIASEKPDLDALNKVLDELHASGAAMHERMSKTMNRFATELSLESRQKIAQRLKRPFFGQNDFKPRRAGDRAGRSAGRSAGPGMMQGQPLQKRRSRQLPSGQAPVLEPLDESLAPDMR